MQLAPLYPLFLLVVGITWIIVLIVRWRTNALIALISAALLIGLLSPRVVLQTPEMDTLETLSRNVADRLGARDAQATRNQLQQDLQKVGDLSESNTAERPRLVLLNAPRLVAHSFGEIMGRIGLAIAFASIVGRALMETGAADRIVRFFVRLFGEKFGGLALLSSGFVLSIPVFFDTVFLLLVPLAKALRVRTGKDYLLYVTAIGAGGAITHSLVPPTPGPIGMADILQVDLGVVITVGVLVGAPLSLVGYAYAAWANRRWPTPLRAANESVMTELERRAHQRDEELPSLFASVLPIILPVFFITSSTVYDALIKANPAWALDWSSHGVTVTLRDILQFFGQPMFALFVAGLVSMVLVVKHNRLDRHQLAAFAASALDDASMILLITCAGGSFGFMLRAVGLGESLQNLVPASGSGSFFIILSWSVAVLFKIAQGSGTVSMITTAGIIMPIISSGMHAAGRPMPEYLGYHPVYLVMAIGCGSMVGSWMNDSGFWVVCKMGGLTEAETLRSWTATLVIMGVAAVPLILLLSQVLPLK
jgi:GntP family gluconate:H+ symporter